MSKMWNAWLIVERAAILQFEPQVPHGISILSSVKRSRMVARGTEETARLLEDLLYDLKNYY